MKIQVNPNICGENCLKFIYHNTKMANYKLLNIGILPRVLALKEGNNISNIHSKFQNHTSNNFSKWRFYIF